MIKSSWLLITMVVIFMLFNTSLVDARSPAMEAARRQALRDLGYETDPQLEHELEVQRIRGELMKQYHPEIYDAEQDYARKWLRGDEVNLIPDSSYRSSTRIANKPRKIEDSDNVSINFPNGDKYIGGIRNGMINGKGTYTTSTGNKYIGEFRDGKSEGQGTLTQKDGVTYVGEFKESKPDGKGTLTFSIGGSYTGEFKAGKLEGNGGYRYLNDGPVITGKWHENQLVAANDSGDIQSQRELGYLYEFGATSFIPKDEVKSIEWYTKAANQGDAESQTRIGEKYFTGGDSVPIDYAKAFEWFSKAANQGNSSGQWWLGNLYHDGKGTPKDMAKAAEWYKKAAEQGETLAEKSLREMATSGECENAGVPEHIPGIKETVILKNTCK